MRSNRLTLFDIEFGKDDVQSSSVINDALLKNIDKVFSYVKHFHNPFSFTKQYICCDIYGLIYIWIVMPHNLLAVGHWKYLGSLDCFVQFDHKLHKLNHVFYHKICHVIFCEFTYVKRLVNYMTKGNLIPELYFAVNLMFNSKRLPSKFKCHQRHINGISWESCSL